MKKVDKKMEKSCKLVVEKMLGKGNVEDAVNNGTSGNSWKILRQT